MTKMRRANCPNATAATIAFPLAIFDASHGQPNWAQTGFASRELGTNCSGLTEALCRHGFLCENVAKGQLLTKLRQARLLVIPPPTGRYDERRECWRSDARSLFSSEDIGAILSFLDNGGCMLAFSYRFGDSFTRSNLSELLLPLGCRPNDDAILELEGLRDLPPLRLKFETPRECFAPTWAAVNVNSVHWRPVATIAILPNSTVQALAVSPGGQCFNFNRTLRQISFEAMPIAVAGCRGRGRFAVFGGPHLFETGSIGLLAAADNRAFLNNTLKWLLGDHSLKASGFSFPGLHGTGLSAGDSLLRVMPYGEGARTVDRVERILKRSGILRALSRARCMP